MYISKDVCAAKNYDIVVIVCGNDFYYKMLSFENNLYCVWNDYVSMLSHDIDFQIIRHFWDFL